MNIKILDISSKENYKYMLSLLSDINLCSDKDAEILSISWTKTNDKLLSQFPNTRAVINRSMGQDNINFEYLEEHNIKLYQIGDYCSESIAMYAISAIKNTLDDTPYNRPTKIAIFGYGRVGKLIHAKCIEANYVCVLIHHDSLFMEYVGTLGEITHIVISMPLTKETEKWLSAEIIQRLRMATIINTSRGAIVDTQALLNGITNYNIRQAVLDVASNNKLIRGNKNIKYTNHSAWCSPESKVVRAQMTCDLLNRACEECIIR